ncbi:MAG: hypothetical protein ACFFG0_02125 [Candidatus Thorarchaeota archaeon]
MLITYCDRCADEREYKKNNEKIKGQCILCGFTGPVNQVKNSEVVSYDKFNSDTWKGGGFQISQLDPFPVGQIRETIHPKLPNKLLTERCAIFYDKYFIVIANPQTGQQVIVYF